MGMRRNIRCLKVDLSPTNNSTTLSAKVLSQFRELLVRAIMAAPL